jgi:hypothetical protein
MKSDNGGIYPGKILDHLAEPNDLRNTVYEPFWGILNFVLWTKLAPLSSPLHINRHNGWDRVRKLTFTRRANVALDYAFLLIRLGLSFWSGQEEPGR